MMSKRKASVDLDEDIKVGAGGETISDWDHGFDVIDEMSALLWNAPEIEWAKVERALTAYPEFVDNLDCLEVKRRGASPRLLSRGIGVPVANQLFKTTFGIHRHETNNSPE